MITKGSAASCNTGKAQGGIQAAIGADDSPEQHAADVYRSSHDTADLELVEALTGDAPEAIAWLEQLGVEFSREGDGYRLARCGGATAHAPAQVGDRTGHAIAHALRGAIAPAASPIHDHAPLVELSSPTATSRRPSSRAASGTRSRRRRRAGRRRPLLRRGPAPRRADHQRAGATGEVTPIAAAAGAETRDMDSLQHHPNGGAWPPPLQGYSIPETTRAYGALLLNAEGERFVDELAPRDAVAEAIVRECEEGRGADHAGRPPGRAAGHAADRPRHGAAGAAVHAAPLPRGGRRPADRADPAYPVLHYQNGGLVIAGRAHHRRGPVRGRRDHRRSARPQQDDGQLPARLRRVRPARGRAAAEAAR